MMPRGIPKNPKAAKAKRAKTRKLNGQKTKKAQKKFAMEADASKKVTRFQGTLKGATTKKSTTPFQPVDRAGRPLRVTKTATGTVTAGFGKFPKRKKSKKVTWPRAAPAEALHAKINPSHYVGDSGQQVIDVLEDFNLVNNMYRGQAIQYLFRAGNKPGEDVILDLEKARWFIQREIVRLDTHKRNSSGVQV